jgi:hypothetical protein
MPAAGLESVEGSSARAFWLRAAAFLAGLAALLAAVGSLDRYFDVEVVGPKLAHLAEHRADYDTLFVGSSLTHRAISPVAYDAELTARGRATRSFNVGVPGMVPPESYFLLEELLALRPARLSTVYLEVEPFQLRVKRVHSRRFEYWHSPEYTAIIVRAILASDWRWQSKLHQSMQHADAMLRKVFHVGQGPALLSSLGGKDIDLTVLGPDRDGWLSTEDDTSERMVARRAAEARLDEVERAQRWAGLRGRAERPTHESALAALDRAVALIRAAGATPILLVQPHIEQRDELVKLVRARTDAELVDLNDPERYPELFLQENRFDTNHMNRSGAELFSRLLAARFAELEGL